MNTKELKSTIHESIENIDDKNFLLAINRILARKYYNRISPKLTKDQIKKIEQAKKQIENKQYLTNEEADRIIDKWLK